MNKDLVKWILGLYSLLDDTFGIFFWFLTPILVSKRAFYGEIVDDKYKFKNPPTASAFDSFSEDSKSGKQI